MRCPICGEDVSACCICGYYREINKIEDKERWRRK